MAAGSFPYPVLGNGDDVASELRLTDIAYIPGVEDLGIRFRVRVDDPTIRELLMEEKVSFCFPWTCPSTVQVGELNVECVGEHLDGWTYQAYLDQRDIRGRVTVRCEIVACEELQAFKYDRQNPQYGEATFDIKVGDILGLGPTFDVFADKLYDPFNPPLSALFRFVSDPHLAAGFRVHFDDDEQVVVALANSLHSSLRAVSHLPHVQLMGVVMPVLMETLHFIAMNQGDAGEDLSNREWHQGLISMLEARPATRNWTQDRLAHVAQLLLENPVDKGFSALTEMIEGDENAHDGDHE